MVLELSVVGDDLPPSLLATVRRLVWSAFEPVPDGLDSDAAADAGHSFADEDWEHTFGGLRVLATDGGVPVGHAAVVPRLLHVGGEPFRGGYVEGVATAPDRQRLGVGSQVMERVADLVRGEHELGALSTGRTAFYARLGWERWLGETYVRDGAHLVRTPDEDDGVMVLRHGPSAGIDLTAAITCEARSGDDW